MIKHYNELVDETYYESTLANGLKVIIFHKPEFHSTSAAFGTPYGALDIVQKYDDQILHFNPGIAHFLEHKMFEMEDGDAMDKFFDIGASVNAFTTYRETVYYFNMPGDDVEYPLNLLLDFVQKLEISYESVEKEKKIIIQELEAYKNTPLSCLLNETMKAMYHHYPFKYDIGGDDETVNAVTKEELEECYAINYHPSNMCLVITTPLNPEKVLKIVEDNQKNKVFSQAKKLEVIFEQEPETVKDADVDIRFPLTASKSVYGIKIKPAFENARAAERAEWALRLLFEAQFSALNPEYQKWMDEGLINDFFGYDIDFDTDAAYILFYGEGRDKKALKALIDKSLEKLVLNEDNLLQLKRRMVGASFATFNDVEEFSLGYIRDYLSGLDIFNTMQMIESLSLEDILDIYHSFNYQNYTLVAILPSEA